MFVCCITVAKETVYWNIDTFPYHESSADVIKFYNVCICNFIIVLIWLDCIYVNVLCIHPLAHFILFYGAYEIVRYYIAWVSMKFVLTWRKKILKMDNFNKLLHKNVQNNAKTNIKQTLKDLLRWSSTFHTCLLRQISA